MSPKRLNRGLRVFHPKNYVGGVLGPSDKRVHVLHRDAGFQKNTQCVTQAARLVVKPNTNDLSNGNCITGTAQSIRRSGRFINNQTKNWEILVERRRITGGSPLFSVNLRKNVLCKDFNSQ